MPNIPSLNDQELLMRTRSLVKEEKRITQLVLDHLQEIEARRLYAKRGFSSLFSFCTKFLGYSESSAQRRISAMRLMRSLPEVKEKLADGSVNLSTLSQLQSFIRKEEKTRKVSFEDRMELLGAIENKSQHECEKEFARRSPEIIKTQESTRTVSESLTKVAFVASEEFMKKLEKLRELLSNKNKTSLAEVLEEAIDHAVKDLEPKKPTTNHNAEQTTSAAAVRKDANSQGESIYVLNTHTRQIPAAVKREVWHRDQGCCQFTDPVTNKKCESRYVLHYDHVIPFCRGGQATVENLRLLCSTHNVLEAQRILGPRVMAKYLRRIRF